MSDSATVDCLATAGKYLTFRLGDEEYGIEILKVREIIGMMAVTRVPRAPDCVRGVINLRGKVIPVVDLRNIFDLDFRDDTGRTCIIVVQVNTGKSELVMGIIVDEVSEVADIKSEEIEPPPSFGDAVTNEMFHGMAKRSGRVLIMLDIDRVVTGKELSWIRKQNREVDANKSAKK